MCPDEEYALEYYYRDEPDPYEEELRRAITLDSRGKFLKLIEEGRQNGKFEDTDFVSDLLSWIILAKAIYCWGSLLKLAKRKPELNIDINNIVDEDGLYPLHFAVTSPHSLMVMVLIGCGAKADVVCKERSSPYYRMTPLEVSITKLREMVVWRRSESVYALIFYLCRHEFAGHFNNAIFSLISATESEKICQLICRYVREGKIIELAALLIADACSGSCCLKHMSPERYIKLRLSLSTQIISVSEEEHESGNGKLAAITIKKKTVMSIMLLLEIFYRTNFYLIRTTVKPDAIARRIVDAGFGWTDVDLPNIDDILAQERGIFKHVNYQRAMDNMLSYLQPRALFNAMPIKMAINKLKPGFALSTRGKRGLTTAVQEYNASQRLKSRYMSMLFTTSQSQVVDATHAKELLIINSSISKKWPVFLSAIRRILHA